MSKTEQCVIAISNDLGRLRAFKESLSQHVVKDFDFDDAAVQVGNALMRYARDRDTSHEQRIRLKETSRKILKATEGLLAEINSDQEASEEVWRLSAAPNVRPESDAAVKIYEERLRQIGAWNADIGSVASFRWKLERIASGTRQTLKELSPKGRPIDAPRLGLGVHLAWYWGYATRSNPTPSNSGDFDNPGTAFGWFAKRSVELLVRHDEFMTGFPGFVESAAKAAERDWWLNWPE